MSWDVSVIRFELQVIRQLPDAIWHSKNHKKSMTSHFGGSTTDQMILGPVVLIFLELCTKCTRIPPPLLSLTQWHQVVLVAYLERTQRSAKDVRTMGLRNTHWITHMCISLYIIISVIVLIILILRYTYVYYFVLYVIETTTQLSARGRKGQVATSSVFLQKAGAKQGILSSVLDIHGGS